MIGEASWFSLPPFVKHIHRNSCKAPDTTTELNREGDKSTRGSEPVLKGWLRMTSLGHSQYRTSTG